MNLESTILYLIDFANCAVIAAMLLLSWVIYKEWLDWW